MASGVLVPFIIEVPVLARDDDGVRSGVAEAMVAAAASHASWSSGDV